MQGNYADMEKILWQKTRNLFRPLYPTIISTFEMLIYSDLNCLCGILQPIKIKMVKDFTKVIPVLIDQRKCRAAYPIFHPKEFGYRPNKGCLASS